MGKPAVLQKLANQCPLHSHLVSTSWIVFISRRICTIHCFGNLICLAYVTTEIRKVSTTQHTKNEDAWQRSLRHGNQLRYTLIKKIQKWTVNIHSCSKNKKVGKEWEHSTACERWNNSNILHKHKYESTYPIAKGNLRQLSINCTPETPEKMRCKTEWLYFTKQCLLLRLSLCRLLAPIASSTEVGSHKPKLSK